MKFCYDLDGNCETDERCRCHRKVSPPVPQEWQNFYDDYGKTRKPLNLPKSEWLWANPL